MKKLVSIILCVIFISTLSVNAYAEGSYNGRNSGTQTYEAWTDVIDSYLVSTDSGFMRVQNGAVKGKILVEYYSSDLTPLCDLWD